MNYGTHISARGPVDHSRGGPGFGCRLISRSAVAQARWEDPDYWLSTYDYAKKHGKFPPGENKPTMQDINDRYGGPEKVPKWLRWKMNKRMLDIVEGRRPAAGWQNTKEKNGNA